MESADNASKHRRSWKLINKISGRKSARQGIIKGKNKEERIAKWFDHFSNLLGSQQVSHDPEDEHIEAVFTDPPRIDDGNFTKNELKPVKESLKEGKQTGSDNIPPEVLKRCDLDEIILDFANNLLEKNEKPMQWSEIDLKPLPKSGDLSNTQTIGE